jgi:hypothetical protein
VSVACSGLDNARFVLTRRTGMCDNVSRFWLLRRRAAQAGAAPRSGQFTVGRIGRLSWHVPSRPCHAGGEVVAARWFRRGVTTTNVIPSSCVPPHIHPPKKKQERRRWQPVQSHLKLDSCGMDLVALPVRCVSASIPASPAVVRRLFAAAATTTAFECFFSLFETTFRLFY